MTSSTHPGSRFHAATRISRPWARALLSAERRFVGPATGRLLFTGARRARLHARIATNPRASAAGAGALTPRRRDAGRTSCRLAAPEKPAAAPKALRM